MAEAFPLDASVSEDPFLHPVPVLHCRAHIQIILSDTELVTVYAVVESLLDGSVLLCTHCPASK